MANSCSTSLPADPRRHISLIGFVGMPNRTQRIENLVPRLMTFCAELLYAGRAESRRGQ